MSFFKDIKKMFAVTEDPTERDIARVKNLTMDIIVFSEDENDTNEKKQYLHWSNLIKKHCRFAEEHGIKAYLIMYKQAGNCDETWVEYEKRLDEDSKRITIERIKYWQVTDPDFYDDHIRGFAKETEFVKKGKKVKKEEDDKKEYIKNIKQAA